MARMPSFEEIRDDFERDVQAAGQRIEQPFRRQPQSVMSSQSQPEVPVQPSAAWQEIHRIEAVLAKFGDGAVDMLEAVAPNPETIGLVVAGARIAHLPLTPGTITGAASSVATIEATWKAAQQAQQPSQPAGSTGAQSQASFTPAGTGTGAQPVQAAAARTVVQ